MQPAQEQVGVDEQRDPDVLHQLLARIDVEALEEADGGVAVRGVDGQRHGCGGGEQHEYLDFGLVRRGVGLVVVDGCLREEDGCDEDEAVEEGLNRAEEVNHLYCIQSHSITHSASPPSPPRPR